MITTQKDKFSLSTDKIYLNCAYMSPILKSVEEAGIEGIKKKRNPFDITPNHFFEETERLRKEYAKLINTREPERIVISTSVSYGMANVTKNIKLNPEENVIVLGEQFPSNYYPWKSLCDSSGVDLVTVSAPKVAQGRGKKWNELILNTINDKTKVVAMSHVHWADGTLFDLVAIRKRTKEVGALLIIDGTQSVGALPFDVEAIQPDALICAGYKWLLGPYSIGLSYYGPYFDDGEPVEENWINRLHSEDFAGLVSYEDRYQPGALRYEAGEHSNFILVPMMLEAVRQINTWGVNNIQAYCKKLFDTHLPSLKNAVIESESFRSSHLFGIRVDSTKMENLKEAIQQANISVSVRGDAIRVSPHLYNTDEEMKRLVDTINQNT